MRVGITEQLVHLVARLDRALLETFLKQRGTVGRLFRLAIELGEQLVVVSRRDQTTRLRIGQKLQRLVVLIAVDVDRRQLLDQLLVVRILLELRFDSLAASSYWFSSK